jgi:hypothetical protein
MSTDLSLPLGFRFVPTDGEIIVHYLTRKNFSIPLPSPAVSDFNVFKTHPQFLPGDLKEKRYFFSLRKVSNGFRGRIIVNCSNFEFWKDVGKDKIIFMPGSSNHVIGKKKTFVLYESERRTEWMMDQYSMLMCQSIPNSLQRCMVEVGDWVVSRIYEKKMKWKNKGVKSEIKGKIRGSSVNKENNEEEHEQFEFKENGSELGPPKVQEEDEEEEEEVCSACIESF